MNKHQTESQSNNSAASAVQTTSAATAVKADTVGEKKNERDVFVIEEIDAVESLDAMTMRC